MTTGLKIKDIADRSGFSPATLRYYEQIGLLPESTRTPAGYRLYDEHTLERLAFIARAKQLGCSLEEIAELNLAWNGGTCGPVQDRLRAVVTDKLASARQQILELTTLVAELQRAGATLEGHRPDGPCDDTCGCVTNEGATDLAAPIQRVTLGKKPARDIDVQDAVPIACTLSSGSMPGRLDEWQRLLAHAVRRDPIHNGLRITLDTATPRNELIRLTLAEQDCCQFLAFAITADARGVALEVSAPDDGLPVLHALFGTST